MTGQALNPSLITNLSNPGGLVLDGLGFMYVSTLNQVGKYSLSGAAVNGSLISNGRNSGIGLALDGLGHLFWANNFGGAGGNVIGEYTILGSQINTSLITGLSNPVAILIVPEPQTVSLLASGAIAFLGFLRMMASNSK